MDELLRLSNQHGFPAPRIEQPPGRYIGYFMNAFGEQLVFVAQRRRARRDGRPQVQAARSRGAGG